MVTPNFTPYAEVLVILKRAGESDVDLSNAWSTIEYEDGLPQSCKITLNSAFGKFMTVAPIIVKFDKLFVPGRTMLADFTQALEGPSSKYHNDFMDIFTTSHMLNKFSIKLNLF